MTNAALLFLTLAPTQASVTDASGAKIPNVPASGRVLGQPFRPDRVELVRLGLNTASSSGKVEDKAQAYTLTFRTGQDFFADQEVKIFFATDVGKSLDNLVIRCRPYEFNTDAYRQQHYGNHSGSRVSRGIGAVHMTWKQGGQDKTEMYSDKISARLEFGKLKSNQISGKIVLVLPHKQQSYVTGAFTARYQKLK